MQHDYQDSFSTRINDNNVTLEEIVILFFSTTPGWIDSLFQLRNKIVSVFGLKAGDGKDLQIEMPLKEGEKIGFFEIFKVGEEQIILGGGVWQKIWPC